MAARGLQKEALHVFVLFEGFCHNQNIICMFRIRLRCILNSECVGVCFHCNLSLELVMDYVLHVYSMRETFMISVSRNTARIE